MDTVKKENLMAAGVNTDEALERFMGNEGMMNRFLVKFLSDQNFAKLNEAVASGNGDKMLEASHTLKGVSGNLAFTQLFKLFDRQVKAIREGNISGALAIMDEITEEYERVTSAIRENCM